MSSNPAHTVDLADLDRRYNFHPFTALAQHEAHGPAVVMARGDGVWLEDVNGKRYIDGLAGLWCVNVGYGRKEIAEAMGEQAQQLSYCHAFSSMSSDKPALLAERLVRNAPVPMSYKRASAPTPPSYRSSDTSALRTGCGRGMVLMTRPLLASSSTNSRN